MVLIALTAPMVLITLTAPMVLITLIYSDVSDRSDHSDGSDCVCGGGSRTSEGALPANMQAAPPRVVVYSLLVKRYCAET